MKQSAPSNVPEGASGSRWWGAWLVVAAMILGGCYLTVRLGPAMLPVLEGLR